MSPSFSFALAAPLLITSDSIKFRLLVAEGVPRALETLNNTFSYVSFIEHESLRDVLRNSN